MTEQAVCIECGKSVTRDPNAPPWVSRDAWIDTDVLDLDCDGSECEATGDEHQVGS